MNNWLEKSQSIFNDLCELEEEVSNSTFNKINQVPIKNKLETLLNDSFIALGMLSSFLIEVNKHNMGLKSFVKDWLKE